MKALISNFVLFLFFSFFSTACHNYRAHEVKKNSVIPLQASFVDDNPDNNNSKNENQNIVLGIESYNDYYKILNNKNLAVFINHTSQINGVLLSQYLMKQGMYVKKIFTPEHGLSATADAGAKVNSKIDVQTGLPIVSLYGATKKPSASDLKNIDIVIFDMQDVGARFYTYISSLQYMMEACADYNVTLIVLDRPNPNGNYVDGPTLQKGFESFVGMQKIPVVHGLTIAEYALYLKGEKLFPNADKLKLKVIPCKNYNHKMNYSIPVFPSPNLKTDLAIKLYPSLCFFEGTAISVGRGTDMPFECFGSPLLQGPRYPYSFIPKSNIGATKPMYEGKACNGQNLTKNSNANLNINKLDLNFLIDAYQNYRSQNKQSTFFNSFFDKLAGNSNLKNQIISGKTESEIRASWQKDLNTFKSIRKKYLLYPDFE